MGLPYSKEIHSAFDQVTPLVAAGFEVVKTTKNIAILLAFLQVYITIILTLNLGALLALLICVNPDLEEERGTIVTPVLKWLARLLMRWVMGWAGYGWLVVGLLKIGIVLGTAGTGVLVWRGGLVGTRVPGEGDELGEGEGEGGQQEDGGKGEDGSTASLKE